MAIDDLTQPLRTRERAALDAARAALRRISRTHNDANTVRLAEEALERIAVLLGERNG
jgi:hypothetical protein